MKLKNGESLQSHLKSFIELFDELSVVGDAIEEKDGVINLLASLPDCYSTLVTALKGLNISFRDKKIDRRYFECNKIRHMKKDCWIYLKKIKKMINLAQVNNTSVAEQTQERDKSEVLIAATALNTPDKSDV